MDHESNRDAATEGKAEDPAITAESPAGEVDAGPLLEALLFASSRPLSPEILSEVTGIAAAELKRTLAELAAGYMEEGRGFSLEEVAGGYQLRSRQEFAQAVARLHQSRARRRFTRSGLETLAIVAYRQPASRAEIEHIRGVDCGAVLKGLLSQSMVRILGRKEAPGRPILYGTTREFLEYFGLRDLESLPTLQEVTELLEEGEIARSAVEAEGGNAAAAGGEPTGDEGEAGDEPGDLDGEG